MLFIVLNTLKQCFDRRKKYIYIIQKIRDDFVILNDRFHESRDVSSENLQFYLIKFYSILYLRTVVTL